jgi:hypothetical protein
MMIYAAVGASLQQFGGDCPPGWVVMDGERPGPDYVAQADGSWLAVVAVPQAVTMRQARIALSRAGILGLVETSLSAMPGQAGEEARIEWDYSSEVHRNKPFVIQLGASLGLSRSAIDQLFITAAGVE